MVKEVIKKGCPINIEDLKKNQTSNSIFHNITVTIDIIDTKPYKLRLIVLRSFESLFIILSQTPVWSLVTDQFKFAQFDQLNLFITLF